MASIRGGTRLALSAAMVVTLLGMSAVAVSAEDSEGRVAYDSIPRNVPGNVVSEAFQATQTSEFGDSVALAGSARRAVSVDVIMSSWGCQSGGWSTGDCATRREATFRHPITLNIYAVDTVTGQPVMPALVSKTQTFAIPFRPSADPVRCTGGRWYSRPDTACYNGLATKITFKLHGAVLPTNVIWTVAFNTSGYGSAPMGFGTPCATSTAGCGYDSLNVGTESFPGEPSRGTDVDPNGAVLNSATPGQYCDGGTGGVDTLRLDTPCWTGYTPLATIRTR